MLYRYPRNDTFDLMVSKRSDKNSTTFHFELRNDHVATTLYSDVFSMNTLLITPYFSCRDTE